MGKKEGNKSRRKGGRPKKADKATNCVMVRFNDVEYAKFLTIFEKSGVYAQSVFIKEFLFNGEFRVVKTDSSALEYVAKLTSRYSQFRAIGTNYNQIVKQLHIHFSEKKALAMLYKLEKQTIQLVETNQQIIELSRQFQQEYLNKKHVF